MLEIQRFDGSRAFILNSASPVRDSTGKIVGSAVVLQDITNLREAERALAEANAQLEQRVRERTEDLQPAWTCGPSSMSLPVLQPTISVMPAAFIFFQRMGSG